MDITPNRITRRQCCDADDVCVKYNNFWPWYGQCRPRNGRAPGHWQNPEVVTCHPPCGARILEQNFDHYQRGKRYRVGDFERDFPRPSSKRKTAAGDDKFAGYVFSKGLDSGEDRGWVEVLVDAFPQPSPSRVRAAPLLDTAAGLPRCAMMETRQP